MNNAARRGSDSRRGKKCLLASALPLATRRDFCQVTAHLGVEQCRVRSYNGIRPHECHITQNGLKTRGLERVSKESSRPALQCSPGDDYSPASWRDSRCSCSLVIDTFDTRRRDGSLTVTLSVTCAGDGYCFDTNSIHGATMDGRKTRYVVVVEFHSGVIEDAFSRHGLHFRSPFGLR